MLYSQVPQHHDRSIGIIYNNTFNVCALLTATQLYNTQKTLMIIAAANNYHKCVISCNLDIVLQSVFNVFFSFTSTF
jgi:hypothetical protein